MEGTRDVRAGRTPVSLADRDALRRVSAEFREMPGLRLTIRQATRLFGLDRDRCERVLGALVDRGELATDGDAFAPPGVVRRFRLDV